MSRTLRTMVLAALLGAVVLVAAAYGSSSSAASSAAAKGNVSLVTWGDGYGEPQSLDPTKAYNPPENTVLANLCESLLSLHPNLTVGPGLAASYRHPAPNTWVYNLRRGVTFWDGHPLTPADVVYSIDRHLNPKLASFWSAWSANIARIRQSGPMQVTLTTKVPSVLTNEMLATGLGVIGEAAYIKAKGANYGTASGGVMCTGPFKLGKWSPGDSITLLRNPSYWNRAAAAHVNTFVLKFITDDSTLTEGLLSGQLEGAYNVPPQAITSLASSHIGTLSFGPSLRNYVLVPTSMSGPLKDPRVRQALSLSIDRSGIANAVFAHHAAGLRWPAPPDSFGYAKGVFDQAYNSSPVTDSPQLAQAKALMKAAGNPSGSIVIGAQAGDTISVAMATDVAAAGQQIGLHVSVRTLPPAQFDNLFFDPKARAGLNFFAATDSYYDVADPIENVVEAATTGAQYNLIGVSNRAINKDVAAALGLPDSARRAKLVSAALAAWTKQYTFIPIVAAPERLFLANRLKGAPVSFTDDIYSPWAAAIGASGSS